MCKDWPVHVIGGGNSSGQAAMFLTQYARKVTLVVRGGDLRKSMSSYLCDRVAANPKIEVRYHTQVTAIEGTEHIGAVHLRDADELQKFFTSHLKPYLNYPFRKESHSVGYSAILLLLRRPACSLPVSGSTR
jgi:thioredoxin reductase (NADPH)